MSDIYTDGAGNKYLGDCKWGNHSIFYPTTKYLTGANSQTVAEIFTDFNSLFTQAAYNNIYTPPTVPAYGAEADIFRFTLPEETNSARGFRLAQQGSNYNWWNIPTANNGSLTSINSGGWSQSISHFQYEIIQGAAGLQYIACAGPKSYSHLLYSPSIVTSRYYTDIEFLYYGRLLDINPNFSYYSNYLNHTVLFVLNRTANVFPSNTFTANANLTDGYSAADYYRFNHYIAGATKPLLTSGRAAYSVVCSDAQTPSGNWATDMWVYDNNVTLGYPVIGRVANMLLGTGTYTLHKPVQVNGSVITDGGSRWYIPIGPFAGKVLLMRCYSSVV